MARTWTRLAFASGVAVTLAGAAGAQEMGDGPRSDWPTYGGSFAHERLSRLDQVTTRNGARLRIAWTFAIPDAGTDDNSLQTTPLVVRGRGAGLSTIDAVMLVTSPRGRVIALDAARGQVLWDFAPPLRDPLKVCCSKSNRGAAFGR